MESTAAQTTAEGPAAAEWRRRGWRAEGEADRNRQQLLESTGTHDLDTTLQTARRTALSSDSFGGEWYAASAARRLGDGLAPTPAGCLLNQTIAARAPSLRSVVTGVPWSSGNKKLPSTRATRAKIIMKPPVTCETARSLRLRC